MSATHTTVTLTLTPAGIAIAADGQLLKMIKDGSTIIARSDRVLAQHSISRLGYTTIDGVLTAKGVKIS